MRKPKKKDEMERVYMRAPADWLARIEAWRKKQTPIPNISESIRQLVIKGLEKERKK